MKTTKKFYSNLYKDPESIEAYDQFHQWVEQEQPNILHMVMSQYDRYVSTIIVVYEKEASLEPPE